MSTSKMTAITCITLISDNLKKKLNYKKTYLPRIKHHLKFFSQIYNHSSSKFSNVFKNASAISFLKDWLWRLWFTLHLFILFILILGVIWAGFEVYQLFLCKLEVVSYKFRAHAMIVHAFLLFCMWCTNKSYML